VTFTAHAFNEDRVKSATATDDSYSVPADISPRTPRAYVITVGVNEYEDPKRRLSFAVADAKEMAASLQEIEGYEVVSISLISDYARDGAAAVDQATKANIQAVLSLLAGDDSERERLRRELGMDVDKLAKSTPDDLVILTFSGHGHTEQGRFYLLPSDSGKDRITDAVLPKLISSEELTDWLRDVDAGALVMIIDACHSAAGVPAGFKPGPMGDRGLGQLAYDKGMRILAATQADDAALESDKLGQGLLTYALVEEGLKAGENGKPEADRDDDGAVTMTEWLGYAEGRVPGLYEEIRAGTLKLKEGNIDPNLIEDTILHAQTPALFDFAQVRNEIVLQAQ
jgi:uncharacterized caspase-like protein